MNDAVAFMRGYDERLVEQIVELPHGRVLLTPPLPLVFYLNHFSVDPGVEAPAAELVDEAEPAFAALGLTHRKITVDGELGRRLEPDFRALGWQAEELLVMPHRGEPPEREAHAVDEVQPSELEPIWEAGIRSDPEITGDEEVRQLIAAQHRRRRAVDVRYFAARLGDGIASYCELFSHDDTGQIESVMTLERHRGRGLATAVITRALRESSGAGHSLTFLVASAADWPKELYRKLGFQAEGSIWDFLRPPPTRGR